MQIQTAPPQRVALITGSGRQRIGQLIARDLASAGYAIAIHYRRSEDEAQQAVEDIQSAGGDAIAIQADIGSEADVRQMFQRLQATWPRLDVLVNTASIWDATPWEQIQVDHLIDNFRVNTLGTFLCARQAIEVMVPQKTGGSIVNFGDASTRQPRRGFLPYYVSKGAVSSLTRSLAVELAHLNPRVRVNCIEPGSVMFPEDASPEHRDVRIDASLVKAADDPQAVVHAVRFLIDNTFLTGISLMLDGGRHLINPLS